MKLDLITNATVVGDAIRFVSGKARRTSSHLAKKNQMNLTIMRIKSS